MNKIPLSLRFIFGFSLAGFLFSGYLATIQLFSGACAFNETCQTVLHVPVCWYDFALFVMLLSLSYYTFTQRIGFAKAITYIGGVSLFGVLFAGTLTLTEIPAYLKKGFGAYTFGVPTCFMGLVFFMMIFVTAALAWSHDRQRNM